MENNNITLAELFRGSDFSNYDIQISDNNYEVANTFNIYLTSKTDSKRMYYNSKEHRPLTNIIDGLFCYRSAYLKVNEKDKAMLLSYVEGNKTRVFIGIANPHNGIVYPVGYDFNRKVYFYFPINKFGLVDDAEMKRKIAEEKGSIGMLSVIYQEARLYHGSNIHDLMEHLTGEPDCFERIAAKLDEYNLNSFVANGRLVFSDTNEIIRKNGR